jgi:hypothetical protein
MTSGCRGNCGPGYEGILDAGWCHEAGEVFVTLNLSITCNEFTSHRQTSVYIPMLHI